MVVHRFGHSGIHLHATCLVLLGSRILFGPNQGGGQGCQRRVVRHQTQAGGTVASGLAQSRPPLVVAPFVFGYELCGRLQRDMVGLKTHIGQKRLGAAFVLVQIADHPIYKIF